MHLQPTMKRAVSVLAVVAALTLCPIWLIAQQTPVPWPAGVTPPVFIVAASAVNGAGVANGPIYFPDGLVSAPSITFVDDTNTGLFRSGTDTLNLVTGGTTRMVTSSTTAFTTNLFLGTNYAVAGMINLPNNKGIFWRSADNTGDTGQLSYDASNNFYLRNTSTGVTRIDNVLRVDSAYQIGTKTFMSVTSPTIISGFGSTPGIVANNGTAAFTISVGTGGTASAGIIGLPTATTGWHVVCDDVTTPASNSTVQTTTSVGSATLTNYSRTLGTEVAWTSADVLVCSAMAY